MKEVVETRCVSPRSERRIGIGGKAGEEYTKVERDLATYTSSLSRLCPIPYARLFVFPPCLTDVWCSRPVKTCRSGIEPRPILVDRFSEWQIRDQGWPMAPACLSRQPSRYLTAFRGVTWFQVQRPVLLSLYLFLVIRTTCFFSKNSQNFYSLSVSIRAFRKISKIFSKLILKRWRKRTKVKRNDWNLTLKASRICSQTYYKLLYNLI